MKNFIHRLYSGKTGQFVVCPVSGVVCFIDALEGAVEWCGNTTTPVDGDYVRTDADVCSLSARLYVKAGNYLK